MVMNNIYKRILKIVKEKKPFSSLPDMLVLESIEKINKISSLPESTSEKDLKILAKEIRAELRRYTGRFQNSESDRASLLENNSLSELINTHTSTKERADFYAELNRIISSLNVKSILDLGCGINPIFLARKGIIYNACDIREDELELVRQYLQKENISGQVFFYDLRKIGEDLPQVDLCLILKVFDVIESKGHKLAEKIILSIKCKKFLISFSTKTLSGKQMNHPQRGWIERLLSRLKYKYQMFKSDNEIFYLAEKVN